MHTHAFRKFQHFVSRLSNDDRTIAFDSEGGSEVADISVKYGKIVKEPDHPTKDGFSFRGWYTDPDLTEKMDWSNPIKRNYELHAHWVDNALIEHFSGKSISIYGDSISTLSGYTPESYQIFYTENTCGLYGISYSTTYWGRLIEDTGMIYHNNCAWLGSCVVIPNNESEPMSSFTRLNDIISDNIPDVILIFAGINDYEFIYHGYYALEDDGDTVPSFEQSFTMMIQRLIAMCPESELIVVTPFISILRDPETTVDGNQIITQICEQYGLLCVDMTIISIDDDVSGTI